MQVKFLSLVWFRIYPAQFGGQKGTALFNEALAKRYPLVCLCAASNNIEVESPVSIRNELPVSKWQFLNPFTWRKISKLIRDEKITHLIVEYPYYGLLGWWLKRKGIVYMLHAHNIESNRFKQLQHKAWPFLYFWEKLSMQAASKVLFKTQQDREFAVEHYKVKRGDTFLLPYGIEPAPPAHKQEARIFLQNKYAVLPDEKILLFAGTLDYEPNATAVESIYRELLPALEKTGLAFKILICGRNRSGQFEHLKELQHPLIIQTGEVEDMTPYFQGVDLFINPVQKAHGVQTKTFDAVAHNLNVVIFEATMEGLPAYLVNQKIFVAPTDDYHSFVQQINLAIHNSFPTPQNFYTDYSWDTIVNAFIDDLKTSKLI